MQGECGGWRGACGWVGGCGKGGRGEGGKVPDTDAHKVKVISKVKS